MASNNRDLFAEIAAARTVVRDGSLVTPQPLPVPDRRLPFQAGRTPPPLRAPRRSSTPDELQADLQRERRRMQRYLQTLTPRLPDTRLAQPLRRFDWREETAADRADFSQVLRGRGRWTPVAIPHYGGPLGRAVTYYRTTFQVTAPMRRKGTVWACFKGVDYKAHVFVNGSLAGSHEGFFAPFEFDVTPHIRPGANTLVVKVENDAICMSNDSWGTEKGLQGDKIYAATGPGYDEPVDGWHHCPPGMGIYQPVTIEARPPRHIRDIFVRPLPDEQRAEVWVEVWNSDTRRHPFSLTLDIHGLNFKAAVCRGHAFGALQEAGPGINYYRVSIDMKRFRWWNPDTPWLYEARVTLLDADTKARDCRARAFGMRSFVMDENSDPKGAFRLNGRTIRLRGANTMGHEQQCVMKGDSAQLIDDILLARLCNMNFLRLTQRPVQEEVYDVCDRLGMMTQTDLPLFGVLRRNQFAEAVRQAGDMEHLVRAHPCNILVSYINEPFAGRPDIVHRNLTRPELEGFFRAANEQVRVCNPDRVIKAVDGDYDPPGPGLPDNHCYCGWYNGHGLDLGRLHHGYWQAVKPGWHYGCGEFGAEGLDPVSVMRRYYPRDWLPRSAADEKTWSPNRIPRAQTGRMHTMWFETPERLEDWVASSQAHQAWTVRLMTEAFRRDARMNTFAVHLFIDAFPSGWMKTIMDVERRPKPAYFAYRDALEPLMACWRSDRFAFHGGETLPLEAWVCNDLSEAPAGMRLVYRVDVAGSCLGSGQYAPEIPACSSRCQGILDVRLPAVSARVRGRATLSLVDARGRVHQANAFDFEVFPAPAPAAQAPVRVLGDRNGPAARLVRETGRRARFTGAPERAPVLVVDGAALAAHRDAVEHCARNGGQVLVLDLPEGAHRLAGSDVTVSDAGFRAMHFCSRNTGHPLVRGFQPLDFRFWHDAACGYPTPFVPSTMQAPGWEPVLRSAHTGWRQDAIPALAAACRTVGGGRLIVCKFALAGGVAGNPVARLFAERLLTRDDSATQTQGA